VFFVKKRIISYRHPGIFLTQKVLWYKNTDSLFLLKRTDNTPLQKASKKCKKNYFLYIATKHIKLYIDNKSIKQPLYIVFLE